MSAASSQMLLIRADAGVRMGTGHIMRCLALAQEWKKQGGEAVFATVEPLPGLEKRLRSEGIAVERLHVEPGGAEDAARTSETAHRLKARWLVLDGYQFQPWFQKRLRESGLKLLVVDDFQHLPEYHVDLLLNQNVYAPNMTYSCNPEARLLLGCHYALLRREFLEAERMPSPDPSHRVLVTLGGADPDNVTLEVVRGLKLVADPRLEVKVVTGAGNPHAASVTKELESLPFAHELLRQVRDMPSLFAWADLVVSSAGSTCWELCHMGTPFLTVVLAENQEGIAKGLEKAGIAINLGWHHDLTEKDLAKAIQGLLGDREIQTHMALIGRQLVDGLGSRRVVKHIKAA